MSKASDLNSYPTSDNIGKLHQEIMSLIQSRSKHMNDAVYNLTEEEITELADYIDYFHSNHYAESLSSDINLDKIKAFILLCSKLADDDDADNILSYMESVEFGWHGDRYYLNNNCLQHFLYGSKGHCKMASKISYPELAADMFGNVYDIFFNNAFSPITLFVFSYCLASLYSSMLNAGGVSVPLFLQIAVDKTSAAYQLLKEIAEICDVNSGILEKCAYSDSLYIRCNCSSQIYFPTQSVRNDIENLIRDSKDRPVLIVGHENEHCYGALLREIANIPTKKKALDLRSRFNLLPIFICPEIKSSFDNVFSINLTDVEVSSEYLELVKRNKYRLASWALKLIADDNTFLHEKEAVDRRKIAGRRSIISSKIRPYINQICQDHTELTMDSARNVGFMKYFFIKYINTIRKLCTFPDDEKFVFLEANGEPFAQDIKEAMDMFARYSEKSLAQLHYRYFSFPKATGLNDKAAIRLARQIEKQYRALKVYIHVTPLEVKEDRYIFTIDTFNNTKDDDVGRNAKTVQRRLKKYEWFRIDLRNQTSIKLIVAEKPLADNSLIEILKHERFADSKLKIPYAIGFDDTGAMLIEDIVEFPHLLLGGATRSGKSTAIMSLLMSIAYKHRNGDVNVLIMDLLGKEQSDFDMFSSQPFLSAPIITEPAVAGHVILLLHEEKIRRMKSRNLSDMPYIVCVIDEFPRLYSCISDKAVKSQLESSMNDLLSSGRHANIHLVLAAQNPSRKDISGNIANISARIALKCSHYQYSNTILGRAGAEKLVGRGQMIFDSALERDRVLQGSYISPKDMKVLLAEIEETFEQQNKYPFRIRNLDASSNFTQGSVKFVGFSQSSNKQSEDKKLIDAIKWSLPQMQVANSRLQSELKIGNNKANRLLSQMEELGLIHKMHGNLGWERTPKDFDEISPETVTYLTEHGLTEDEIRCAFSKDSV